MKNMNDLIESYTNYLQHGEIQIAYKEILSLIGKLRAEFVKKYPHDDVSSVYQGYMDMSYFSLSKKSLKDKGLKIAIVYLHEKGSFEVWLSARNREISKKYASLLDNKLHDDLNIFHDINNLDAIAECILTATPDFEDQSSLINTIDNGVKKFITKICALVL